MIKGYVYGAAAAAIMGLRTDNAAGVWRIIADRGDKYRAATGAELTVEQIGAKKLIREDSLRAFALWYEKDKKRSGRNGWRIDPYAAASRDSFRRGHIAQRVNPRHQSEAEIEANARRAALRRAIIQIKNGG